MNPAISLALAAALSFGIAGAAASNPDAADIAIYDRILAAVQPGQRTVAVGDMVVPVATVQRWRNALANGPELAPASTTETGINLWPSGNVYYAFNPLAGSTVSAIHQADFAAAAAEWAMFANLHFIPQTNQANYILVSDGGTGEAGGLSAVGMIGGAQPLDVGSTSWNRATLTHEIGHALGLVHEHQRSDRDAYVNILTDNIVSGAEANFTKIPDSIQNTPYDFLSVMHYSRNELSSNPATLDTIEPLAAYSQYLNVMGLSLDRVLSRGDRTGMAIMYSAGPVLSSTVTNTLDTGVGSLRAALYYAFDYETDHPGTPVTINFQIPTSDPGFANGVFTIQVIAQLPAPGPGTTIDGTTQIAFTGNTNPNGPVIVLDGGLAQPPDTYATGLRLVETGCVVKGIAIGGFSQQGVYLTGAGAVGNTVSGCYLGAAATGVAANPNAYAGVEIDTGASGNTIGGTTPAARNVISGNTSQGLYLHDSGTSGNIIEGNYIGLDAVGSGALPNGYAGIEIANGAQGNMVGGSLSGAGNVISGNTYQGVAVHDTGTMNNTLAGNWIGPNAAGTATLPNGALYMYGQPGVDIYNGAQANTVGGAVPGARNVLSGNSAQGLAISDAGSSGNLVLGNIIGLNPAGTAAMPNAYSGVGVFSGATGNIIGGVAPGSGNVISGNANQGVLIYLAGANGNFVEGNLIGLNAAGTAALPNAYAGVEISTGAQNNLVGGLTAASGNVISGNSSQGVAIDGAGATNNLVEGNLIGLNPAGTAALPNQYAGAEIFGGATANTIGGALPGSGNVISGNSSQGVALDGTGTNGNTVAGNFIGLNAAGTAAVPNAYSGVELFSGPQSNVVGAVSGGRNYVSGNTGYGITLDQSGTNLNVIEGNTIGLLPDGAAAGNLQGGISIFGGAQSNLIGGTIPGAANIISGNAGRGVDIFDASSTGNTLSGNSIFGNAGIGINLVGGNENQYAVTANDPGDADTGPNNLQNYPLLTSAVLGIGTAVSGTLNSTPGSGFRVELFASAVADPSGYGPGETFLGAVNVSTDSGGNGSFSLTLPACVPAGQVISATATDATGDTSEFCAVVTVTTTDSSGDGIPDVYKAAHPLLHIGVNEGSLDADGDGSSNLTEFLAGTDPDSASSAFRLPPVTVSNGNVLVNLPTVAGHIYRIQFADGLATPTAWQILADQIFGTGTILQLTDPGAASIPHRFYRAVILP